MDHFGVIFDMDGVLVDSYQAHWLSWQQTAGLHRAHITEADFARTFGRTSREIIQQLWPNRFTDDEIVVFDREKELAYRNILQKNFPEMPGASDLIAALHAADFRLAIGSSGPAENVAVVKRCLRNGHLISAVVHGGEVQHGKPDPQVFRLAAQKLSLPPALCAVIEDAPVGLEAGCRAGMSTIALTGTAPRHVLASRADCVVESLRHLSPQVVAQLIRSRSQSQPPPTPRDS